MKPGYVWEFVDLPDLGAKDKVRAALTEAMKNVPEGEQKLMEKTYYDMVDPSTHRDSLTISPIYRQK